MIGLNNKEMSTVQVLIENMNEEQLCYFRSYISGELSKRSAEHDYATV